MRANPFLKRFSFVRHLGLTKEELKWLQVQIEKVEDWRRYGLLLEFMLTLQDESKVAAFRWVDYVVQKKSLSTMLPPPRFWSG